MNYYETKVTIQVIIVPVLVVVVMDVMLIFAVVEIWSNIKVIDGVYGDDTANDGGRV
jgi:hypothetical protein